MCDFTKEYKLNFYKLNNMNLLFGWIINETDPEDEPDEPEGPEEIEDRFPAESVAQEAADRQRNDSTHLQENK